MEIIDFHTHPFTNRDNNICNHIDHCGMSVESTRELFRQLGVSRICGSVVAHKYPEGMSWWDITKQNNEDAYRLWKEYGDFYIPGIHIHPENIKGSCEEIERAHKLGVKLVGELVPYFYGWDSYVSDALDEVFDLIESLGMVLSVHPTGDDDMDEFVRRHPNLTIVAAHPGEYGQLMRHFDRMKMSENYYLDVSGYGIYRHGVLRCGIDLYGVERFIFGSDYPTCNPGMYIGGVMNDTLLTDSEKEKIMSLNAKRLLGL